MSKTYIVGPYHEDWVAIIHAETREQARSMGMGIGFNEYIEMRAIRAPELDGRLISNQVLIDAGYPEIWEGEPIDFVGYILDCGCGICKESLAPKQRICNA